MLLSLLMSVWISTVSKALERSIATVRERLGGFLSLKPLVMVLLMLWRAVVVEWLLLNPCCMVFSGMSGLMMLCMILSSVLASGERREMGRNEVPSVGFLSGFRAGMMLAVFQVLGMILLLVMLLKSVVM